MVDSLISLPSTYMRAFPVWKLKDSLIVFDIVCYYNIDFCYITRRCLQPISCWGAGHPAVVTWLLLGSHVVSTYLCTVRYSSTAYLLGGFSAGMFHAIKLTLRRMRLQSGMKGLHARLPPPSIPGYMVGVANMYLLNILSYYPPSHIIYSN